MIVAASVAADAKMQISLNPKFNHITPELDAIISAVAGALVNATNAELSVMRTQYNVHTHITAVGPTATPLPPMA